MSTGDSDCIIFIVAGPADDGRAFENLNEYYEIGKKKNKKKFRSNTRYCAMLFRHRCRRCVVVCLRSDRNNNINNNNEKILVWPGRVFVARDTVIKKKKKR